MTDIVCAIADDMSAADVLLTGRRLARVLGLRLRVVHVALPEDDLYLQLLAELDTAPDELVLIRDAYPAVALERMAADLEPVLLVMGARAQGSISAALLGSVTRSVVRHRRWPVLVVRAGCAVDGDGAGPIVAGVGRPGSTATAVAGAAELIAHRGGQALRLVHVVPPASSRTGMASLRPDAERHARESGETLLAEVAATLGRGVPVTSAVRAGALPAVLADEADRLEAEMIVVGHRAAGLLVTALSGGSTGQWLVAHARRPVLLLPEATAAHFIAHAS